MSRIPPHIVQAPRGVTYPAAVACIALRSGLYPDPARPRCYTERLLSWVACGWFARHGEPYGEWSEEGEVAGDLWKLLRSKARARAPLWVVSNRTGRDLPLLGVWALAEKGEVRLGVGAVLAAPPTIVSVFAPARMLFVDIRNWTQWRPEPHWDLWGRAWHLAEIMHGMIDALRVNGWGSLRLTAGAQAHHTWRFAHLNRSVVVHTHQVARHLELDAYFGGRCEPFRLGHVNGGAVETDIRSSYAAASWHADVPCLLESVHGPMPVKELAYLLEKKEVVADVEIETDEPAYPLRHKRGVIWPVGRFGTVLHSPELRDALALRRIRSVYRAACYRGFDALSRYVESVYPVRLEYLRRGNHALARWLKFLLVCLPGTLAARYRRWGPAPWYTPRRPWEQRRVTDPQGRDCTVRVLAGKAEVQYTRGWAWDAVPAIAGWVTSAARMRLLEEIRTAGWCNVHYVDTDSLYVNAEGARRLAPATGANSEELGALRLVAVHPTLWIGGVKHLVKSGKLIMGGVYRLPEDRGPGLNDYFVPRPPSAQLLGGRAPDAESILTPAYRGSGYHGRQVLPLGRTAPLEVHEDGTQGKGKRDGGQPGRYCR